MKLDLRYNDLPTFPVLPKMPKLQQIVLQGNQISSFEKDTFILSPQINMISLQENELQEGFESSVTLLIFLDSLGRLQFAVQMREHK